MLLTAIGSFSAASAIESLHDLGFYVIGTDINDPDTVVNSKFMDEFYKSPLAIDKEYLSFITNLVKEQNIDYVLPLTDPEIDVLSPNRYKIVSAGAKLMLANENTINICRDKFLFYNILKENNIEGLIPTVLAKTVKNHKNIGFPCVLKKRRGRSSEGMYIIQNADEYRDILRKINIEEYILQHKIGDDTSHVVTADVIRNDAQNLFMAIARRELTRTYNGAGLAIETFVSDELFERLRQIAKIIGLLGAVNMEFIEYNDQYYILECNPRFSAGIEFSKLAGYDFVKNHTRCFTTERLTAATSHIKILNIARRYEAYVMEDKSL